MHGGEPVGAELRPAAPGTGIAFVVGCERHRVPATLASLHAGANATWLSSDPGAPSPAASVATVEHLLAALAASGVDDSVVVVQGAELPVLDGSAGPFVEAIEATGLVARDGARPVARAKARVRVEEGDRWIAAEPADVLAIDYTIDFAHPAIGRQRHRCDELTSEWFRRELAPARTFGFLRDVDALRAAGLARGASLDNTVVFDERGVRNPEPLRYPDEPVRHKALDLVGDLALLGAPLRARITAHKAGHALHHRLVRTLLTTPDTLEWHSP